MSIEISNHYSPDIVRPKLPASVHLVHEPDDGRSYHHHPFLIRFRGRFFLCFSSGTLHEDDVDQQVVYTASDDLVSWDEVRVLAAPARPETELLIPQGVHRPGCEVPGLVLFRAGYRRAEPGQGRRHL
ncbi:MAG: hypothetical protein IJE07_04740 [Clostridia bacterium]|nr:hypothetical protein [Clostridia bacterium]